MKVMFISCFAFILCFRSLQAVELPEFNSYQTSLMQKVGEKLPELSAYPFLQYPNAEHSDLPKFFPQGKVRIFGYGSLINKASAGRSVKPEAVSSMRPVVAFGVKRVFNYKASKTDHWGSDQHPKEKAMLNLIPSLNYASIVNGVVMDVDEEDLARLVQRETGYDLVPVLIASWTDVMNQNASLEVQVAYTFVSAAELRDHRIYTSTQFYPVRGYLNAIQEGNLEYGKEFSSLWDRSTYLADGTTTIEKWDKNTFEGILCTQLS